MFTHRLIEKLIIHYCKWCVNQTMNPYHVPETNHVFFVVINVFPPPSCEKSCQIHAKDEDINMVGLFDRLSLPTCTMILEN